MNSRSNTILFWASFFTLIAAGMGFAIRGDILADWGRDFGFTQTDLGIITGQGPGGLVLGALVSFLLNQLANVIPGITWQLRWGIVFAPMLLYGVLMLGRRFPASEAKESGISARAMMQEVGLLGAGVVVALLGLWLSSDIVPWLLGLAGLPEKLGWLGWVLAGALWVGFGSLSRFRIGHWMLAFLYILHGLVGYVELGTDSWIQDI